MQRTWLILALVGAAIPAALTACFVRTYGWDGAALVDPLRRNSLALMAFVDLVFSVLVFLLWSFRDARRRSVRGWPAVLLITLVVGLCSGLPAYLYLRERARR